MAFSVPRVSTTPRRDPAHARLSASEHSVVAITPEGKCHRANAQNLCAEVQAPGAGATLTAEEVFRRYAGRIYNLARRLLSNEADVEDVTQEVLLLVVRKLGTFRGDSEFATWLHRVTVNAALIHRRKHAPRLAREASVSPQYMEDQGRPVSFTSPWAAGPDRQLIDRETRELIEAAVRGLPEKYRDPFVLSDIEGLPNAEIAGLLGLSLPALKSRLHRARLLLRDTLRPHFEHGEPLIVPSC